MTNPLVARAPWWAKIGAKIILSRLPVDYSSWSALGLFRHGSNDNSDYAYRVFKAHHAFVAPTDGFVTLELGPGDAVSSAILSQAFGGSKSFQVDVGRFADGRPEIYMRIADHCRAQGLPAPSIVPTMSFEDIQTACGSTYLTEGLRSMRSIDDASIDFLYSQSCLEHVRLNEFDDMVREMHRILRPGAAASHWVDLQDHFNEALNNLRFSEKAWESPLMAEAGFYTNRLRFSDIRRSFEQAGFDCEITATARWDALPTPRAKLNERYQSLPEEELLIRGFNIVARRKLEAAGD